MNRRLAAIVTGTALRLDRRGVTALEYGIVAAFLGVVLVGVFFRFGGVLSTMFTKVTTSI